MTRRGLFAALMALLPLSLRRPEPRQDDEALEIKRMLRDHPDAFCVMTVRKTPTGYRVITADREITPRV